MDGVDVFDLDEDHDLFVGVDEVFGVGLTTELSAPTRPEAANANGWIFAGGDDLFDIGHRLYLRCDDRGGVKFEDGFDQDRVASGDADEGSGMRTAHGHYVA